MKIEGGCYCGALRFEVSGDAVFRGQCHCRECQYFSGGHPNPVMALPDAEFSYTKGSPKQFTRTDLDTPVTREFCADCGTHLLAKSPNLPGMLLFKIGCFDDPAVFGQAEMAIYTSDKQAFHHVPDGIAAFEKLPG